MTIQTKAPDIRFENFSGDWQDKEIGSILAETRRPVELLDKELYQLVTVRRRNEGVVPRASLKGKDILVKNYYGIKAGDYLISKRQVVHGANGIVPESLDNAVVSNEYLVVTDSDEITAKFWALISRRAEIHKLFFISSYGVDIEKLVFDVTDWKNRVITIPDVTEQCTITDYFRQLDSLINQHQQKHNKISNIKKAMLEKMFPKQGETIPEIRFKGFSGEWEESNLEKCTDLLTGNPFNSKEFTSEGFFLVRGMNVKRGYLDSSPDISEFWPSSKGLERYLLEPEDIVVQMDGALIGKSYAKIKSINLPAILVQRVTRIRCSEVNSEFIYQYIQKDFLKHISGIKTETAVPHLSLHDIRSFSIFLPEIEEQNAIGNYFQKLDALINQHQQQITKLNNIKQACLSKMFV